MVHYDVAVLGGGLVGMAAVIAMHTMGFSTVLIDRDAAPSNDSHHPTIQNSGAQQSDLQQPDWDNRVYAISPNNVQWLSDIGIWQYVDTARVSPIGGMALMFDDVAKPLLLNATDANQSELAVIVESNNLSQAMLQRIKALNLAVLYESTCQNLTVFDRYIHMALAPARNKQQKDVPKQTAKQLESKLLLAADGAHSWVRQHLQMATQTKPYAHTAIVANFKVETPHANIASQWFMHDADGQNSILAFLPLPTIDGAHYISIVWSVADALAETLSELTDDAFSAKVSEVSHHALGLMTLVTPRACFPLMLQTSEVAKQSVILMGDAAHVVHPMAGQGVNLGFRDLIDLTHILQQKHRLQAINDPQLIKQYSRYRKADVRSMQLLTDGLFQLLAERNSVVKKVRQWGFAATTLQGIKQRLLAIALKQ